MLNIRILRTSRIFMRTTSSLPGSLPTNLSQKGNCTNIWLCLFTILDVDRDVLCGLVQCSPLANAYTLSRGFSIIQALFLLNLFSFTWHEWQRQQDSLRHCKRSACPHLRRYSMWSLCEANSTNHVYDYKYIRLLARLNATTCWHYLYSNDLDIPFVLVTILGNHISPVSYVNHSLKMAMMATGKCQIYNWGVYLSCHKRETCWLQSKPSQ